MGARSRRAHAADVRHRRARDGQEPARVRAGRGGARGRRPRAARRVPRGRGRAVRPVRRGDRRRRRRSRGRRGAPPRRRRRRRARPAGTRPRPRLATTRRDGAAGRRLDAGGGARRRSSTGWWPAPPRRRCCSSSRTSTGRRRRPGTPLRHLVRRAGRAPLLVVATTRDSRPDLDADLATLLGDLERSPAVRRVALHGLDRDEVAALTGTGPDDADVILAETHGNPLLVTHLTSDARGGTLPVWLYRRDQLLDDEHACAARPGGDVRDRVRRRPARRRPWRAAARRPRAAGGRRGRRAGRAQPAAGGPGSRSSTHCSGRRATAPCPCAGASSCTPRRAAALATRPDDERLRSERARHACLAVPLTPPGEAVAAGPRRGRARRAGVRLRRGGRPLPARARGGAGARSAGAGDGPRSRGPHRRRPAPPRRPARPHAAARRGPPGGRRRRRRGDRAGGHGDPTVRRRRLRRRHARGSCRDGGRPRGPRRRRRARSGPAC